MNLMLQTPLNKTQTSWFLHMICMITVDNVQPVVCQAHVITPFHRE